VAGTLYGFYKELPDILVPCWHVCYMVSINLLVPYITMWSISFKYHTKSIRSGFSKHTITCVSVFKCLCTFFQTYIGNMLLSINPFKPLKVNTEELRQKYKGKEQHTNSPWAKDFCSTYFNWHPLPQQRFEPLQSVWLSYSSQCWCLTLYCSLLQPCIFHSWFSLSTFSGLHTGAMYHHKVSTKTPFQLAI